MVRWNKHRGRLEKVYDGMLDFYEDKLGTKEVEKLKRKRNKEDEN